MQGEWITNRFHNVAKSISTNEAELRKTQRTNRLNVAVYGKTAVPHSKKTNNSVTDIMNLLHYYQ